MKSFQWASDLPEVPQLRLSRPTQYFDLIFFVHILLGIAISRELFLALFLSPLAFIIGLVLTLTTKNQTKSAQFYSAYIVGAEILLRMAKSPLPYEFSKYAVSILMFLGYLFEYGRKRNTKTIWLYFFLLLPSILVLDVPSLDRTRQLISFNLSGPLSLTMSLLYFYGQKQTPDQIRRTFAMLVSPIISLVAFLTLNASDFSNYSFRYSANFDTSGGFGPNQVSTALGLGLLILLVCLFWKRSLTRSATLAFGLISFFIFRGFLTFSRGGVIAPIAAVLICILALQFRRFKKQNTRSNIIPLFIFIIPIFLYVGYKANEVSQHRLTGRYMGETMTRGKTNYLSGREKIMMFDLTIFLKHPVLGVGPGGGMELRSKLGYGASVSAHNEPSRMLAEHGILGLIALLIMLGYCIQRVFSPNISREDFILTVLCISFAFLSMGHSAMRLSAMGFIFGLGFLRFQLKEPKASRHIQADEDPPQAF